MQLKEAKRAEKEELQRRRQGDEVFASRVGQMARKPAARDDKKKKNNKNRVAGFDAGFGKASQAGRARARPRQVNSSQELQGLRGFSVTWFMTGLVRI